MSEHVKASHELLDGMKTKRLPLVLVESPLSAATPEGMEANKAYARACMRDCIMRGEAPFASHLMYAQEGLLDDNIPEERALGIHAGLEWGRCAAKTVVYTDRGVSSGMQKGIERALAEGREVLYRDLGWKE